MNYGDKQGSANTKKRGPERWRLSVIWLLTAPGIIVYMCLLVYAIFTSSTGRGESQGWAMLGLTLVLAPVLLMVGYAGFLITAFIGILAFPIIRSKSAPKVAKLEVIIACVISLVASVGVHFVRLR
jgi:hypothetical protein